MKTLKIENHILKRRELFHQYIVDIFAKIETDSILHSIELNHAASRRIH